MLQQLFIQNYAIIDELRINFTQDLNIITGETGAGKSILMGALGLILGDRADTSSLRDKQLKCIVEGQFKSSGKAIQAFFKENDLDEEEEILLRREISASGKSRAFINDTPVTLAQLKTLSALLVDLHRQFDIQELTERTFQLEVLDALCGHENLIQRYHAVFSDYKRVTETLNTLRTEQHNANKEFDYHQFLFNELEQANFLPDEIEQLEAELKVMSHSESIKETLSAASLALEEGEEQLLQNLRAVASRIDNIKDLVPALADISSRIHSSYIELKDIAGEIESVNADIAFSEERMNEINTRIDTGYTLLKKHHVQSTAALLQIQDELSDKLQKAGDMTIEIEKLEAHQQSLLEQLKSTAVKISDNRKKQVPTLTRKVNQLLMGVGMPNASFKVDMGVMSVPGEHGIDTVEFLFNANKTSFQPIRKVASGGELSRLMLIIKSLVAQSMKLPTLIFDEIDTGISGEAARQVGIIIKELSADHQVLLITHQPQIAARAYTHFFVFKETRENKILTGVRKLSEEERIHAIATMLSGDKPTAAAFENAREMMN